MDNENIDGAYVECLFCEWDSVEKTDYYAHLAGVKHALETHGKMGHVKSNPLRPHHFIIAEMDEMLGTFKEGDDAVFDPVQHPEHYARGSLECIDWIEMELTDREFLGYLKGNAMKYLWRYEDKGHPVQDLKKAKWYIDRLIQTISENIPEE